MSWRAQGAVLAARADADTLLEATLVKAGTGGGGINAPIEPPTCGTLTGDRIIGDRFEWTRVDSLQPALRWQQFPRPADLAAAPTSRTSC